MRPGIRTDIATGLLAAGTALLVCAGTAMALSPSGQTAVSGSPAGPAMGVVQTEPAGSPSAQPTGSAGSWHDLATWPPKPATSSPAAATSAAPSSSAATPKPPASQSKKPKKPALSVISDSRPPRSETDGKTVYLTFDDGPSAHFTGPVLDVLAEHDATATFFFLGSAVRANPALAKRVVDEGHGIGNHSWSHKNLRKLKAGPLKRELDRAQAAVLDATGVSPTCVRPPYGATDERVRKHTKSLGLGTELWDVDPRDWDERSAKAITRGVLQEVTDGSIVLLHDGGGDRATTLKALPKILTELKARGFKFAALCQ